MLAIASILVSLFGSPSRVDGAPVIAVFDVDDANSGLDAHVLEQLTDFYATKLIEVRLFRVVPRARLRARLRRLTAKSYEPCYSETCQIRVGRELAAQKALSTRLLRLGEHCSLTTQLFDLETLATEAGSSVTTTCDEGALREGAGELVQRLRREMGAGPVEKAPERPAQEERPADTESDRDARRGWTVRENEESDTSKTHDGWRVRYADDKPKPTALPEKKPNDLFTSCTLGLVTTGLGGALLGGLVATRSDNPERSAQITVGLVLAGTAVGCFLFR